MAPAEPVRRISTYEYRSRLKIGSLPLIHIVRGVDPSTGARPPAIGIIAIGQVAMGVVAIGQRSRSVGSRSARPRSGSAGAHRPARDRDPRRGPGRGRRGRFGWPGRARTSAIGVDRGERPVGGDGLARGWIDPGAVRVAPLALARPTGEPPRRQRRFDLGAARRLGPRRGARRLGQSAARAAVESAVRVLAVAARRPGHSRAGARRWRDRRRR